MAFIVLEIGGKNALIKRKTKFDSTSNSSTTFNLLFDVSNQGFNGPIRELQTKINGTKHNTFLKLSG